MELGAPSQMRGAAVFLMAALSSKLRRRVFSPTSAGAFPSETIGPALANDPIEQEGRRLGNLVIFDKEFLKLVDDQQRPGEGLGPAGSFVAGDVLGSEFAEQIAATLEFLIEPLKHAQAEFAVALDGHDASVRQTMGGVALELDALLKVDQVELDLFGT